MKTPPRLRELREERMLSQNELAKRSGVAQETVARLERGEGGALPRTIRRLAAGLEVSYEELFAPKMQTPPSPVEASEERREQEERDGIGSVRGKTIGVIRTQLEEIMEEVADVGTGEVSLIDKVVQDLGRLDEQLAELQRGVEEGQRARGDAVGGAKSA